jgi:hypothetical protein
MTYFATLFLQKSVGLCDKKIIVQATSDLIHHYILILYVLRFAFYHSTMSSINSQNPIGVFDSGVGGLFAESACDTL